MEAIQASCIPDKFKYLISQFGRRVSSDISQDYQAAMTECTAAHQELEKRFYALMVKVFSSRVPESTIVNFRNALISGPKKPQELKVASFYNALKALSNSLKLLSNKEELAPLTDEQIKHAFWEGCPESWKKWFCSTNPTNTAH